LLSSPNQILICHPAGEEHWSTLTLRRVLCPLEAGDQRDHWWHGSYLGIWAGPC